MEQVFVSRVPPPMLFTPSLAALAQHIEDRCLNGVRVKIVEQIDRSPKSTAISGSSRKADDKAWIEPRLLTWITLRIRDHTAAAQHHINGPVGVPKNPKIRFIQKLVPTV